MYFVLDLICVMILAASVVRFWQHAVSHVLFKCLCAAIALTVAATAGAPLAQMLSERWTVPYTEKKAAADLGEILNGTREEQTEQIAFDGLPDLMRRKPTPYLEWLGRYGATPEQAQETYAAERSAQAMVRAVVYDYAFRLTRGAVYVLLWLAVFLLCGWAVRRVEWNMTEAPPRRGLRRLWAPLSGLLYGVLMVMSLSLFLEWVIPAVSGDSAIWSADMLTKGTIYPILRQINPFIRLYFS